MSRAAIYQLFRRIPDADDASIDAAVDALADQRLEIRIIVLQWMVGILTAAVLGMLWMLFGIVGRLSAIETALRALAAG